MTRTRVAAPQFTGAAEAHDVGQQPDVNLNPQGKGQDSIELAPAVSPRDLETAAFFEQPVEILLHDVAEDTGPLVLNVSGEDCVIPRNQPVVIKRKFVQQLLDMRETKFTQPGRDMMNVERGNRLIPKTVLLNPFSVSQDPHPHGREWLMNEQRRQASIVSRLR